MSNQHAWQDQRNHAFTEGKTSNTPISQDTLTCRNNGDTVLVTNQTPYVKYYAHTWATNITRYKHMTMRTWVPHSRRRKGTNLMLNTQEGASKYVENYFDNKHMVMFKHTPSADNHIVDIRSPLGTPLTVSSTS